MTTDTDARKSGTSEATEQAKKPMDRLLEAAGHYAAARGERVADSLSNKITGATGRLTDAAEKGGAGLLPSIGIRKLKGKSTLGAVASAGGQKVKDVFKKVGEAMPGKKLGQGKGKSMNITETIDVGVPLEVAYNQWTQYEEFSEWAKGVTSVDSSDETSSDWKVKVGPSSRSWRADVQTQVPDERITWTSEGAKGTTRGVVTFHEITERLTRIVVVVEYYPSGPVEKIGNLWRAGGRRLRLDLKNFRRFVMMSEEEPEGWRGEIRDGEVVRGPDEEPEDEERGDEEDEEQEDEEQEDEEDDYEPEDEADDEYEDEEDDYEDEDEDEEFDEDSEADQPAGR
ncbi:MAG TPA: SRPBCC family protein [Yinghuangia sp.]|uniref:SRPBCC family protein n=1 Tax=Yinghuangia sp. YIM S10712 TaxID=3436930 RepID=UPI002BB97A98|nr:SRPBCC family protein [Yinghuangia sp.]